MSNGQSYQYPPNGGPSYPPIGSPSYPPNSPSHPPNSPSYPPNGGPSYPPNAQSSYAGPSPGDHPYDYSAGQPMPSHPTTRHARFDSYQLQSMDNHDVQYDASSIHSRSHLQPSSSGPGHYSVEIGGVVNSQNAAGHYGAPSQYAGLAPDYPPQHQSFIDPHARVAQMTQKWIRKAATIKRRKRTIPRVEGNLVVDVDVPEGVIFQSKTLPRRKSRTQMRYSAATCDPDEFTDSRFSLRQYDPEIRKVRPDRENELFIVMTMYNEGSDLLLRTLNSVIKNIEHLATRGNSKIWGHDSWKKVVVCIVADGREPCNGRVLQVLQLMGVYIPGIAQSTVANEDGSGTLDVQAHIYEFTATCRVTEMGEVEPTKVPIQIIFCLKETNKKKINSHRWFFNAFARQLDPRVCVLLDVGTKPTGTSIYELHKVFVKHENVGGACGEIYADTGSWGKYLFNPLVAGQNFEYKMSNILDKPFESVFGFISVLPGAFSAYRYRAALGEPLDCYFEGEKMNQPGQNPSIMKRNMFLAEDRILAFEIVAKKNASWRLQYVKSAKASTDVPTRVPEFISQRRRWLNGSIFASAHALIFFYRTWTSGHNIFRKLALQLLHLYNFINLLFNLLALSSYYLAFFFLVGSSVSKSDSDPNNEPFFGAGDEVFAVFQSIYIVVIVVVIICSLGNRPQGSNRTYTACIVLFACCQAILLYCAGFTVYKSVPHTAEGWKDVDALFSNRTFVDLALSLMATYGLYLISSLMYLDPWHMITSFIQYLLLLPSYVNILLIYAFCNLHDVSWGTKGDNGAVKNLGSVQIAKDDSKKFNLDLPTKDDLEEHWRTAKEGLEITEKQMEQEAKKQEKKDKKRGKVNSAKMVTKRSDSDRNFRTNVLLAFFMANMVLIYIFTSPFFTEWVKRNFANASNSTFNPYLTFIFYCVLGISGMRFLGCTLYLILTIIGY